MKNSKWLIILYNIYTNLKSRWYTYTGIHKTTSGSILKKKNIRESIEYVNSVYKDYIKYGKLKSNDLREKVILEIGPGDNFGVALNFLMNGASKVICIDKFYSSRLKDDEFKFYLNFRKELSESKKLIFDKLLELDSHIKLNQKKLEYHFGIGIEDALKLLKPNSIDIVVSRSVLEHIHYIDAAMHTINKILLPGGLMIHKVDLREHRMFSSKPFHPLEFLTIPKPLYNLMTKYSGKPNRKLMDYYFYKMIDLGYNFKILITSIIGNENEVEKYIELSSFNYKLNNKANNLVEEIRSSLCREFRTMSKKNLMVSGIFLIAKKPS